MEEASTSSQEKSATKNTLYLSSIHPRHLQISPTIPTVVSTRETKQSMKVSHTERAEKQTITRYII